MPRIRTSREDRICDELQFHGQIQERIYRVGQQNSNEPKTINLFVVVIIYLFLLNKRAVHLRLIFIGHGNVPILGGTTTHCGSFYPRRRGEVGLPHLRGRFVPAWLFHLTAGLASEVGPRIKTVQALVGAGNTSGLMRACYEECRTLTSSSPRATTP